MKKLITSFFAILLVLAILFNITGCNDIAAGNLTDGLTRGEASTKTPDEIFLNAQLDFAAKLFQLCAAESEYENTLISPLSVMTALAMTANGAEGLTEEEMEAVLGGGMSIEDLNAYLYAYNENLSEELTLANSIWFRANALNVNETFLQTNKDYYDAEIYEEHFNSATLNKINGWVNEKTKGMIPKIIERLDPDMVMVLINALAFEAEWEDPYEKSQQTNETFTSLNGGKQNVTMMHSLEKRYLEDENTTGFIKYYKGGSYAFAALLPDEDVDFSDYVNSLDGEKIKSLLNTYNGYDVYADLPKFENDYQISMVKALQTLGIQSAFSGSNADLSGIGTTESGALCIGDVLHKTYISLDNLGTKAGAVTAITVECTSAEINPREIKHITLDRPFVYMIIDTQTNLPIFIGTMTGVK